MWTGRAGSIGVIGTGFLLEYLSSAPTERADHGEQITASTNKVEAYHRFAKWLFFSGEGLASSAGRLQPERRCKRSQVGRLVQRQDLLRQRLRIRDRAARQTHELGEQRVARYGILRLARGVLHSRRQLTPVAQPDFDRRRPPPRVVRIERGVVKAVRARHQLAHRR